MIWNTELKREDKGSDLRPFEALSQNFPGEVTKTKTFRMGMFEPASPEYQSSFYLLQLLTYWLPIPVQVICVVYTNQLSLLCVAGDCGKFWPTCGQHEIYYKE